MVLPYLPRQTVDGGAMCAALRSLSDTGHSQSPSQDRKWAMIRHAGILAKGPADRMIAYDIMRRPRRPTRPESSDEDKELGSASAPRMQLVR